MIKNGPNEVKRYSDIQILVAKKAVIDREQWVLDGGTGPDAFLAIRLAEIVGRSGLVIAVDYERTYVSKIKDAIARSKLSDIISFVLADLRYTLIRDCCLDAAVSLDMVQNMYGNDFDVEEVVKDYIKESTRIVKSGRKVVVGTRQPVPRNKAQEVYMEFRLFDSKLEYTLWKEQCKYYFEHELISWFEKAGLQDVETEIIEHNIAYPREYRIGGIDRTNTRLKLLKSDNIAKLEEKFQVLLKKLDEYGEEWLPTLIIAGTKVTAGKK